jgi:prevent-host-death family protein
MTTMTSREFNQDASRAKRAAMDGPVFITDRGEPAHVLLTIEDYKKLAGPDRNLAQMLACPEAENIDFKPRKLDASLFKAEGLF